MTSVVDVAVVTSVVEIVVTSVVGCGDQCGSGGQCGRSGGSFWCRQTYGQRVNMISLYMYYACSHVYGLF